MSAFETFMGNDRLEGVAVDCIKAFSGSCQGWRRRPLCPTPGEQAQGPDWLEHSGHSPLHTAVLPPGSDRRKLILALGTAVEHQQPARVLAAIARDSVRLFAVTRPQILGMTPISRWQFQTTYPTYPPWVTVGRGHVIVIGLQRRVYGPFRHSKLNPSYGGRPRVHWLVAGFLRFYQLRGGYTPGPLLAIAAIAGLIGSAGLLRRRRRTAWAGDQATAPDYHAALACFLVFTAAVAVLLTSDLFEFSWRYQLPALITLPPAGALGIGVILAAISRGRGKAASDGGAPLPQLAVRTSGAGGTA